MMKEVCKGCANVVYLQSVCRPHYKTFRKLHNPSNPREKVSFF
jgi:hypothetical protein